MAIEELQESMKGYDKAAIEAKTQALGEKSGKLADRVNQEQGAQEGAATAEAGAGGAADDDVVDAEFEEVKDADNK